MKTTLLILLVCMWCRPSLGQQNSYLPEIIKLSENKEIDFIKIKELQSLPDVKQHYKSIQSCQYSVDSLHHLVEKIHWNKKKKDWCNRIIAMAVNEISDDIYGEVRTAGVKTALKIDKKIPLAYLYDLEKKYSIHSKDLRNIERKVKEFCPALFDTDYAENESSAAEYRASIYKDQIDVLQLKSGDTLAEIGAGDGMLMEFLSRYSDSLNVYINEIDPVLIEKLKIKLVILDHLDRKSITYRVYLGSEVSTCFPNFKFSKILIKNAFHHFNRPYEMLVDIHKRMDKNSTLFITDALKDESINPLCKEHLTRRSFMEYLNTCNFTLLSEKVMQFPNFKTFEFQIQ